jgi:hypothetical protein
VVHQILAGAADRAKIQKAHLGMKLREVAACLFVDDVPDPVRGRMFDHEQRGVFGQLLDDMQKVLTLIAKAGVQIEPGLATELEREEREPCVVGAELGFQRVKRRSLREIGRKTPSKAGEQLSFRGCGFELFGRASDTR